MSTLIDIKSITQAHQLLGLDPPKHPLISVYEDCMIRFDRRFEGGRFTAELYLILFKDSVSGSLGYGRNSYDFQEGTLVFVGPGQVPDVPPREVLEKSQGWSLIFHPDLVRKSHLGEIIDSFSYFDYDVNEALHLSSEEQVFIYEIVRQLEKEYSQNLDKHSHRLIISNLELLLNYCTRFYDRQFYTRTSFNKDLVAQFERLLKAYFNSDRLTLEGIPSVSYFGEALNMSANYLSDLLKKETGKSVKAHINEWLIDKAKTALLSSSASVSEIAYDL
ncbi:MAG: helix-turn-helix domain-containing protein, partial [Phaeodactylibacter sp.]|nr:helix-turn-helix domain-containing protein [Phaeodactylibacter sp.]